MLLHSLNNYLDHCIAYDDSSEYNQGIIDMEKYSFNVLVFTARGGMAPEYAPT